MPQNIDQRQLAVPLNAFEPLWVSALSRITGFEFPDQRPAPPGFPAAIASVPIAVERSGDFREAGDTDPFEEVQETPSISAEEYGSRHEAYALAAFADRGFEAMAWYAPISFYGPKAWGIYFDERAVWGLASACAKGLSSASLGEVAAETLYGLDRHESFHSAVELFALVADDLRRLGDGRVTSDGLPLPYDRGLPQLYTQYSLNDYQRTFPTIECVEESLATAYQLRARLSVRGLRGHLISLTERGPAAYAGFKRYAHRDEFYVQYVALCGSILGKKYLVAAVTSRLGGNPFTPRLWTPQLAGATLRDFGPVPRYFWRSDTIVPSYFAPSIFGNVRVGDIVSCLRRNFNGTPYTRGGRHSLGVRFPNGKKVPYSSSWTSVPPRFLKQVANAVRISPADLKATCL